MTEPDVPASLLRRISDAGRVLIISHKEPDGDCIGSSLAMASALQRRGTDVHLFNVGPFDRGEIRRYETTFRTDIPEELKAPTGDGKESIALVLDCSTASRIGDLENQLSGLEVCVIDHHASGEEFGDERWVIPESPSTTYLVQLTIEALGLEPTLAEAEHIMFGYATDTGFFRHLSPHQGFTFHALARLCEYGASPRSAHGRMYGGRTLESRHLIGKLLDRIETHYDRRLLTSWESIADTDMVGKENRDSDAFYQLVFSIDHCEALIFLREESPGRCTGSLRSRDKVDVGRVAAEFGGGGHKNAAGFLAEGSITELMPRVVAAFSGDFAERANAPSALGD